MRSSTSWNLAAWCLMPPVSYAAAAAFGLHASGLAARADTGACGGDGSLTQCGNGLPSDFCCPQQTQCIALNNTGTDAVICCPNGSSCNTIQTITCDITLQDPTKYPSASVHVGDLTKALPLCGTQCCPLGFSCQTGTNGAFCQMKNETKAIPSTSASSSSTRSSLSPTTSFITAASATGNSTSVSASSSKHHTPAKFIVAGVIPSLFVIAGIIFCCLFWKRRKIKKSQISEPIREPQQAVRTDFLTRTRGPQQPGSQRPSITEPRPATSDTTSTTPLTQIKPIAPLQVRTLYPPPKPFSAQNQNRVGSTATIGTLMPLGAEDYGPRYVPSTPAVDGRNPTATKRDTSYQLPTGRFQQYQAGR